MRSDWSNTSSDSPTILLSPKSIQSASCHPFNQRCQPLKPFMQSQSRNIPQRSLPSSSTSITMNPSRKRARDESPDVTTDLGFGPQWSGSKTGMGLMHGEVSTTFYPRNGELMMAQSKKEPRLGDRFKFASINGTESSSMLANNHQDAASRQRRKFQRRIISPVSELRGIRLKVSDSSTEPAVDHFTHLLGVGWARISDDKDVQAAARGWSRYIENHYPLSMVRIVLKSKGLEANLAETKDGFFLFKDDLSEGRLVGSDWESCLANLQRKPITFQGPETLKAGRINPIGSSSSSNSVSTCIIDSSVGSIQIETSWLYREDDEMVVS